MSSLGRSGVSSPRLRLGSRLLRGNSCRLATMRLGFEGFGRVGLELKLRKVGVTGEEEPRY